MKETESRTCKYSRDDPDVGRLQNKLKLKCEKFKERFPFWFEQFTGHSANNFTSFNNFVKWMHIPVDAASLGIFRILFGITMLIDIPEERGGGNLDIRFGEPKHCHFPLFDFIRPLGLPQMGIVYLIMWLGAFGMALGYKFKISCLMFIVPYWYVFLLDKPAWNNHSYLYGLCGLLFLMTNANRFGSLDNWGATREQQMVPFWNYFIIKFQFFILYFVAGLKKLTTEWLSGYSMINLGYHWVFAPFRTVLSVEMIELLIIHWFIAIFDVSIAFWMTYEKTRLLALPFMISFHLMNSRLFTIGMFPWVCLAELPLFFPLSCPRNIWKKLINQNDDSLKENVEQLPPIKDQMPYDEKCHVNNHPKQEVRKRKKDKLHSIGKSLTKQIPDKESTTTEKIPIINKLRIVIIFIYCFLQFFLPYSHFITKGYNNWTNGIYGYSWDMMVHSYDTILTSIKIVDNKNGKPHYLEPYAFSEYDRWTKHADMAIQYAKCIQKNLLEDYENNPHTMLTSKNISIYIDVWCSMNNRFQQRVFDPRVDLLKAKWSPFEKTKWVLPVLNELNHMRPKLNAIASDVLAWSNHSDVMFIADFTGLTMENFISPDLDNVTLSVLQGAVHYRSEKEDDKGQSISSGQSLLVTPGEFHQVTTISLKPSCYMYTYVNKTMQDLNISVSNPEYNQPMLPLWSEFKERLSNYKNFFYHIGNSIMFLAYGVPMPVRIRERE